MKEIIEKADELYDLLSKAKDKTDIGNSKQHWIIVEAQTALSSLIENIGG